MKTYATIAAVALLSACASPMMMMPVDNAALPEPVRVPAGQKMMMVAPGVVLEDEPALSRYPLAREAAGRDEVVVGRIREDTSHPRGLVLWVVSDNLRKGAATNTVQIAESLVTRGWL